MVGQQSNSEIPLLLEGLKKDFLHVVPTLFFFIATAQTQWTISDRTFAGNFGTQ